MDRVFESLVGWDFVEFIELVVWLFLDFFINEYVCVIVFGLRFVLLLYYDGVMGRWG